MASKLKEQAAEFIRAAGLSVKASDLEHVTGYNKRIDCYRFEFIERRGRVPYGSWLSLTQFVKECKKYGGAEVSIREAEVWPAYPKAVDADLYDDDIDLTH